MSEMFSVDVQEKKGGVVILRTHGYLNNLLGKEIISICEEKIAEGIRLNFNEHKIVTEGAAATSVMVAKDNLSSILGKNIICLICGGNIETKLFNKIIS